MSIFDTGAVTNIRLIRVVKAKAILDLDGVEILVGYARVALVGAFSQHQALDQVNLNPTTPQRNGNLPPNLEASDPLFPSMSTSTLVTACVSLLYLSQQTGGEQLESLGMEREHRIQWI